MGIKLLFLLLLIAPFSSVHARGDYCRNIFRLETYARTPELSETVAILKNVPTDSQVLVSHYRHRSVEEMLTSLMELQSMQLAQLRTVEYSSLPQDIITYYFETFQHILDSNRSLLREIQIKFPLKDIPVREAFSDNGNQSLKDHINSFIIPLNAAIAEFATALTFNDIVYKEERVDHLFGTYWKKAVEHFSKELSPELLDNLSHRKMDVTSMIDGKMTFIEVKYLGTRKIYAGATGHSVLTKLTQINTSLQFLPYPAKVVLALVGPGRLSKLGTQQYQKLGIDVVYITPEW